jgi:hypothetical protein
MQKVSFWAEEHRGIMNHSHHGEDSPLNVVAKKTVWGGSLKRRMGLFN